jgi:hypothetical protein
MLCGAVVMTAAVAGDKPAVKRKAGDDRAATAPAAASGGVKKKKPQVCSIESSSRAGWRRLLPSADKGRGWRASERWSERGGEELA